MTKKTSFTPPWCETIAPPGSRRSLFKYGDPAGFKHPGSGLYAFIKETFGMTDADFQSPDLCMDPLPDEIPSRFSAAHLRALKAIVGEENIRLDTVSRVRASYGAGQIDALRLRHGIVENIPEAVISPRSRADVEAIVHYCNDHRIPLYVYGGGSTVTRGMEAVKGGICLDLSVHMCRVLSFNETDQTITVEPGIWGPELEDILNRAPETLSASRAYTCGHFPQSFEHSSVGGWVVTRGAGQNSTYYGKIEDILYALEMVFPGGIISTPPYPRSATGPDFRQILAGSEGTFGVVTSVTLRVFRHTPQTTRRYAWLFRSWEDALETYREVMQSESGFPSVFRLSDPEETDVAMRTYHIHGTPADSLLRTLGFKPMQRCLLLGTSDGQEDHARLIANRVNSLSRRKRAFPLSPFRVVQSWEKSRFTDPFLREDLSDFGILIDTLECAVPWSKLKEVHAGVRAVVKARPQTVCMTHLSHAYPQGANLYFIFIARMSDISEYLEMQYSVLEAIQKTGAAMSHHHGIGKQTAPWLEEQIGNPCMDVLHALKNHFDPRGILNPGGTLGLDMTPEQRGKRWGIDPAGKSRSAGKAELERRLQEKRQKYE
jgi:alkyldihydroxyacetonephosphate synthase